MITTFKKLKETKTPDPYDVIDTMEYYAKSGLVIDEGTATDVLRKAKLSRGELQLCLFSASKGQEVQMERSERRPKAIHDAEDYGDVVNHIRRLLDSSDSL